ncbi:ras guanine nucleotide exchange factor i-related [Anaeramoeba ignava]|uniref:Ras guanine nucleotide exchange factor i-related n=1 Tax=Anaeramoeba ignava TaxID=1746090 RepID=A0A9Q0L856_ANAIG|nr:ras guanine nucleotide exchange factor i-related [Anaeramoeba ignava]
MATPQKYKLPPLPSTLPKPPPLPSTLPKPPRLQKSQSTQIPTQTQNINQNQNQITNSIEKPIEKPKKETELPKKKEIDFEKHPRKILYQDPSIDRSKWHLKLIEKHPEIQDLRERLIPIERTQSFGEIYNFGTHDVKENLSDDMILQVIMQHLGCLGYKKTRSILEEESKIKYQENHFKESRLRGLLRISLKEIEKIYDIVMESSDSKEEDPRNELLEQLIKLGYEDEDENEIVNDVFIWDEPPDSESNIIYADESDKSLGEKEIKAATLNKLIEKLTHDGSGIKIDSFLMTFQSFTTKEKLLQKLIHRYHVPKSKELSEEEYQKKKKSIQLKVINVLLKWVDNYFSEFSKQLIQQFQEFIENTLIEDNKTLADKLKNAIYKKQKGLDAKKTVFESPNIPDPIVPKNIFSPNLSIFHVHEEEIARQMTLIEFKLYSKIQPTELLNQAWSKAKYKHRAPNVLSFIQRFNDTSGWVATTITKSDRLQHRVHTIEKFIKIAEHLRALNNFNGLTSVLAGLNNAAVYRLKHSWSSIKLNYQQTLESLKNQMDSSGAYKTYRELLKNVNPPCIPYLGIYLTDLTFIEDGVPDFIGNLINYTKRSQISKVILNIQQYQQKSYEFQYVHQISQLLLKIRNLDDSELYNKSLEIEPRNRDISEIK